MLFRRQEKQERSNSWRRLSIFIRDTEKEAEPDRYIGLANIEGNTGELVSSTEEPGRGQCFVFQKGDVLYGRLRALPE